MHLVGTTCRLVPSHAPDLNCKGGSIFNWNTNRSQVVAQVAQNAQSQFLGR